MENFQKEFTKEILVEGNGENKFEAISDALQKISKEIISDDSVTVQISPLNVNIKSAEKNVYTERFLWLFLPRKRENFHIQLLVQVSVKCLDVDSINFEENKIESPDQLPILSSIWKHRGG